MRLERADPDDPGARLAADHAVRHRRAEAEVAAAPGDRRDLAGVRAVGARGRVGPGLDAHHARSRTATSGSSTARRTGSPTPASPTTTSSSPRPTARTTGSAPSSSRPTATGFDAGQDGAQARDQGLADRPAVVHRRAGAGREPDRRAEGKGLSVALGTLQRTRLGAAAQAVGIAQGATDYANEYAKERIAFGKPINQLQGLQFKLADMETRTAAARELLYRACAMVDSRPPRHRQVHLDGEALRLGHRDGGDGRGRSRCWAATATSTSTRSSA